MASPIQYTPQFIPTDMGLMERTLGKTQQRADNAFLGLQQADSQFASTVAFNQDRELKDEIINEFRTKSSDIVKKYGNDYAKASKSLAKEIVNTGNNPFFQLAELKKRGVEQYNQLRSQYGSDAIDGSNPANIAIKQGDQYTSPEDFNPIIYSSSTLDKGLKATFGPRMNKLDQTLMQNLGPTGVLTSETIKGITDREVPTLAEEMYIKLKQEAPLGNDQQLRDKANSTALSYVQGQVKSFMGDPTYQRAARAASEIPAVRNYTAHVLTTEQTGVTPTEALKLKEDYRASKGQQSYDLNNLGVPSEQVTQDMLIGAKLANKKIEKDKERALKPFKSSGNWNELTTKYGLSEEEAVDVIADDMSSKPLTSKMTLFPVDKGAVNETLLADIGTNINTFDMGDIEIMDYQGNIKTSGKDKYEKSLKEAISNGTIQHVSIDVKGDKVRLHDKSNNVFIIPTTSIGNEGTRQVIKDYSDVMSVLYGDTEGESKRPVQIGGKLLVARRMFDPQTKKYTSNLIDINTLEDVSAENLADRMFTDIFSTYGVLDKNRYGTQKMQRLQYQGEDNYNGE